MRHPALVIVGLLVVFQATGISWAQTNGSHVQGIQWLTDFDAAMALSRSENKTVFIDFFNPN
ncbi:MAG: hypothetical protein NTW27_03160 [Deltaproteobacteria bacterium]|nr:hypothetical protein [Deltaproteobacteria bacterium]